jgi:hypothetical protein
MGLSLYNLLKAGLLVLNACAVLHPGRFLRNCEDWAPSPLFTLALTQKLPMPTFLWLSFLTHVYPFIPPPLSRPIFLQMASRLPALRTLQ